MKRPYWGHCESIYCLDGTSGCPMSARLRQEVKSVIGVNIIAALVNNGMALFTTLGQAVSPLSARRVQPPNSLTTLPIL